MVAVGEGQTFYKDIADDQVLTWEKGPQGGHHVWIALRSRGLHKQGSLTTIDIDDVEDPGKPLNVNHSRLVFDLSRDEGGYCTLIGLRMQLDNDVKVPLAGLMNHHLRVTATVKDVDGTSATGERRIVVKGDVDGVRSDAGAPGG
jgi:hypothetical protein